MLLLVLAVTLTPVGGHPNSQPAWCIVCGTRGLADFLGNILLFVPLGLALAALGWSWWRVALAGTLLSVGIEALQVFVVTGRDASIGDVLGNGLGALAGALAWLVIRRLSSRPQQLPEAG